VLIGSRLQQLSVVCTAAAIIATPTAIAAATAKPGAIYVNVITKRGKPDFKSTGYQICATKTAKASKAALKQCAAVRSGQAALTIPAGVWYLHSVGGTGQGPCYNRLNNGAYHAACSPVAVKAGRTTTVHWFVPRAR
jgi:hypothetical protein